MAKHYKIEGNKIIANIEKLSDKELETLKKYIALGFSLEEPKKVEKKEPKQEFTAPIIQAWLKANGTKEQIKKYWDLYNEVALDKEGNVITYKKDCASGKKGEKKIKGHIGTLSWFKQTFPNYAKTEEEIAAREAKKAEEAEKKAAAKEALDAAIKEIEEQAAKKAE